ncbi:MAG: ABC transporter permease [Firmicutes bacterium]|nr:ABC transporter permease [Bacillota bacterium]
MRKLLKQTEFYLALVILLLSILITMYNPRFLSAENIFDLLKSFSVMGIMAVGVLFVLILGGTPDVSFTAIAQVAEYVVVIMTLRWGGNILLAFLTASLIGGVLGRLNGCLVNMFRVPTIIITIATSNIFFGLLYVFSQGQVIYVIHPLFRRFSEIRIGNLVSQHGVYFGLSLMPLIWLVVLILGWFVLNYTRMGRDIYAIGGSELAAERVGIPVRRTKLFVFTFVGVLAGIAAVVHAAIVQSAIPNSLVGQELDVIAAVFLGGASVFGGAGTILGTFLGILLLAVVNNGLTLLGVSSYWYNIFVGAVIVISITISAVQRIRQKKTRVKVQVDSEGWRV